MNLSDQFQFTAGQKRNTFILMGIGVLTLIIGVIMALSGNHTLQEKVWTGILTNNMFFLGLSLAGLFFIAVNYIGYGGWYLTVKRIPEAMSMFIPYMGIGMLIVVVGLWAHWHHIYHWAAEGIADPSSENYDRLIAGKTAYLNKPFFTIRVVAYFAIWIFFAYSLRKLSIQEDQLGGVGSYNKSKVLAALFLVFFGITSSAMSWDFMMSIDSHWYSTLFGWYTFSTLFVSGIAAIILFTIFLKSKGYLPQVNQEHLHDLGKFLFAFSVFWTYLWFSQFMLIWYANLGESTIYFKTRMDHYPFMFYMVLIINFVVPFFALMTRHAKRQMSTLATIAVVVLIGHWFDYFLMIVPGATGNEIGFGFFEIGLTIGYAGLFLYVVLQQLTKTSLVATRHPFYKESLEHHT